MPTIKLAAIPVEEYVPVRFTIAESKHAELLDYLAYFNEVHGSDVDLKALLPHLVVAFPRRGSRLCTLAGEPVSRNQRDGAKSRETLTTGTNSKLLTTPYPGMRFSAIVARGPVACCLRSRFAAILCETSRQRAVSKCIERRVPATSWWESPGPGATSRCPSAASS